MLSISNITSAEKTAAIADRDTKLAASSKVDGKYVQIMPHETSPGVECQRHVYFGPKGVGYTDICIVTKSKRQWICRNHTGPETYRDKDNGVWSEIVEEA